MQQMIMSINRSIFRLLFRSLFYVLVYGCVFAQEIQLPYRPPVDVTLQEAIEKRLSVREFQDRTVEREKLSWLLWAVQRAWDDGEAQGRVMVRTGGHHYIYDPLDNTLRQTSDLPPELRMFDAPVGLYLLSKKADALDEDRLWLWRGMVGQAVYLAASALSLGTVTIGGIGFPVGYPRQEMSFEVRTAPDASNLPSWPVEDGAKLEDVLNRPVHVEGDPGRVTRQMLSFLLWSAYGTSHWQEKGGRVHRTVPSARGRYPMEVVAFSTDSVFYYDPENHRLEGRASQGVLDTVSGFCGVPWLKDSPCAFAMIWNKDKMDRRGSALWEAGAMTLNLRLAGMASGLGFCWLQPPDTSAIGELLGLDPGGKRVPLLIAGMLEQASSIGAENRYRDGTYTGGYDGWPGMKVEVVVLDGRINEINILEDTGTPEYSERVKEVLPGRIIFQNDVDVDAVSGATLSSNTLKEAVKSALDKAKE